RKCPIDKAYSDGFFFNSSARSVPGAGALDTIRKKTPAMNTRTPTANKAIEEIRPDFLMRLSNVCSLSCPSHPPTNSAKAGRAGIVYYSWRVEKLKKATISSPQIPNRRHAR